MLLGQPRPVKMTPFTPWGPHNLCPEFFFSAARANQDSFLRRGKLFTPTHSSPTPSRHSCCAAAAAAGADRKFLAVPFPFFGAKTVSQNGRFRPDGPLFEKPPRNPRRAPLEIRPVSPNRPAQGPRSPFPRHLGRARPDETTAKTPSKPPPIRGIAPTKLDFTNSLFEIETSPGDPAQPAKAAAKSPSI